MILLAHEVSPAAFGSVAFGLAAVAILTGLLAGPTCNAIVAKQLESTVALDTAWWMTTLPCLMTYVIVGALAYVFGVSGIAMSVVIGVGVSLPLNAGEQVLAAHLQQALHFKRLAFARAAGTTLGVIATCLLLASGSPISALIARSPLCTGLEALIMLSLATWRPGIGFDLTVAKLIFRYARSLAVFNAVNQLSRKSDDLIVGTLVDAHALGLYSVAYRFIEVPVIQVNQAAQSVTFPVLMRLTEDARARAAFLRSLRLLVWFVAPVSIVCVALGDAAVPAFLGAPWREAGPIVQIFGVIVFLQVISAQSGIIFFYKGKSERMMYWGIVTLILTVVCFLVGSHWGALGVAWGYLIANLLLIYPLWRVAGSLIGLRPAMLARCLVGVSVVAVAAVGGLAALCSVVEISGALGVGLVGIVTAVLYWAITLLTDRRLRADAVSLLPRRRSALT